MGQADIVEDIDTLNGLDLCITSHQHIVEFRNTVGAGTLNTQVDWVYVYICLVDQLPLGLSLDAWLGRCPGHLL